MQHSIRLNTVYWLLLIAPMLSLVACGFHPRGQEMAPAAQLSPIRVSGLASHHSLYRQLTHQLETAGADLARSEEEANTLLIIHRQKTDRRVLSVDSRNKRVEYEIEESLEYSIQHPPGTSRGDRLFLSVNRILFNPGIQILGRDREETLLQEDMYKQLSRLLMNQLAAIR